MPTIVITKLRARLLSNRDATGEIISQNKVAAATGLDATTLSFLANGKKLYTPRHLEALCRYFECEPSDLAGYYEFTFPD